MALCLVQDCLSLPFSLMTGLKSKHQMEVIRHMMRLQVETGSEQMNQMILILDR
jgi:hypothetical protein